jgi:hypothetical protein
MTSKPARELFSGIAIAALMAICLATAGCSKTATPKVASDTKAFESASPEIKADWEKTMSAVTSNDYATAILTCRKLQEQSELTPEQHTAVNDTMTAVNDRLAAAVEKGDQNAINAMDEVRKNWRSN